MPYRVPVSLIRGICYPTSYRLPKISYMPIASEVKNPSVYVPPTEPRWRRRVSEIGTNLPKGDYRFFKGSYRSDSPMATCRWCEMVLSSKEERKKHGKGHCTVRLVSAYKLLLAAEKCAICMAFTKSTTWGIPLCPDRGCREEWKIRGSEYFRGTLEKIRIK